MPDGRTAFYEAIEAELARLAREGKAAPGTTYESLVVKPYAYKPEERTMPRHKEPVPITGVWVRRDFPHLGGKLRVFVEFEGSWRELGGPESPWPAEGLISHIIEPAGIRSAPVVQEEVD